MGRLLDAAAETGIRLVHTGEGPGAERMEHALFEALPLDDPWAVTVTRSVNAAPVAEVVPPAGRGDVRVAVEFRVGTTRLNGRPSDGAPPSVAPAPNTRRPWGVALPSIDRLAEHIGWLPESRPDWVRLPFHLLNAPKVNGEWEAGALRGARLVASDPFSGGLLDGGWLHGSPLEEPGPPRAVDWATTRARLAPVAALGDLTRRRDRPLAAVALSYLRGHPGVVAVLAGVRSPDDVRRLAMPQIALTAAERARIERREMRDGSAPRAVGSNTEGQ